MRRLFNLGDDRPHRRQKIGKRLAGLIGFVDVRIAGIGYAASEFPLVPIATHTLPSDAVLFEESLRVLVGSDVAG